MSNWIKITKENDNLTFQLMQPVAPLEIIVTHEFTISRYDAMKHPIKLVQFLLSVWKQF